MDRYGCPGTGILLGLLLSIPMWLGLAVLAGKLFSLIFGG